MWAAADLFFSDRATLARTLVVGALAYVGLVLILRVSGKRSLAKMNSFDLVVTVALGSSLATVLLNQDVSLAQGMTAIAILIVLQFAVSWLSVRSKFVRAVTRSEPRLLLFRGEFLDATMRAERVTRSEVVQAIRSQGVLSVDDVQGVVLETDGTFSVVSHSDSAGRSSLAEVGRGDSDIAERG